MRWSEVIVKKSRKTFARKDETLQVALGRLVKDAEVLPYLPQLLRIAQETGAEDHYTLMVRLHLRRNDPDVKEIPVDVWRKFYAQIAFAGADIDAKAPGIQEAKAAFEKYIQSTLPFAPEGLQQILSSFQNPEDAKGFLVNILFSSPLFPPLEAKLGPLTVRVGSTNERAPSLPPLPPETTDLPPDMQITRELISSLELLPPDWFKKGIPQNYLMVMGAILKAMKDVPETWDILNEHAFKDIDLPRILYVLYESFGPDLPLHEASNLVRNLIMEKAEDASDFGTFYIELFANRASSFLFGDPNELSKEGLELGKKWLAAYQEVKGSSDQEKGPGLVSREMIEGFFRSAGVREDYARLLASWLTSTGEESKKYWEQIVAKRSYGR